MQVVNFSYRMDSWIKTTSNLILTLSCIAYIADARKDCSFPLEWSGSWFQNGVGTVTVTRIAITLKGRLEGNCTHSNRDKYLIKDSKKNCYKCLAITEKHSNVLQYKMSTCSSKRSLKETCKLITGDAPLFTMFRVNGQRVDCPFSGAFKFSYDEGRGSCQEPMSHIDECTDKSKLQLTYQACADVPGSEHRNKQLDCLATWKDGSSNYLVGRFTHGKSHQSDEDSYRCFMYKYDETSGGYTIAQSADATCNAIFSSTDGPTTLKLQKVRYPLPMCSFPKWMTDHKQWRTLQGHYKYVISSGEMTKMTNHDEVSHKDNCIEIHSQMENLTNIVTFAMDGCHHGYRCYRMYRRGHQIIEIQKGAVTISQDRACAKENFEDSRLYETLLPANDLKLHACPHMGRYKIISSTAEVLCKDRKSEVTSGCHDRHTLAVEHLCKETHMNEVELQLIREKYICHGHWEEDGISYLVASDKNKATSCFILKKEDGMVRISNFLTSCERLQNAHTDSLTAYNVTTIGSCFPSLASLPVMSLSSLFCCLLISWLSLSLSPL